MSGPGNPEPATALPEIKIDGDDVTETVQQLAAQALTGEDERLAKITEFMEAVKIGPATREFLEIETADKAEVTCILGVKVDHELASRMQDISNTAKGVAEAVKATYIPAKLTVIPLLEVKLKLSELHKAMEITTRDPEGTLKLDNFKFDRNSLSCEATDNQSTWYDIMHRRLGQAQLGVSPLCLRQIIVGQTTRRLTPEQVSQINTKIGFQRMNFPKIHCASSQTVIYPQAAPDRLYYLIEDGKHTCFLDAEGVKSFQKFKADRTMGDHPTLERFSANYESSGTRKDDLYCAHRQRVQSGTPGVRSGMGPEEITPIITTMRRASPMMDYQLQQIVDVLRHTDNLNVKIGEMNFQLGQLLKTNSAHYSAIVSAAERAGVTTARQAAAIQMVRGSLLGRLGAVRFEEKRERFTAGTRRFDGPVRQADVENLLRQLDQELNHPTVGMLGTEAFRVSPLVLAPTATNRLVQQCEQLFAAKNRYQAQLRQEQNRRSEEVNSTILDRVEFNHPDMAAFTLNPAMTNWAAQLVEHQCLTDRYQSVLQAYFKPSTADDIAVTEAQLTKGWELTVYLLTCYEHVLSRHARQLEHVPEFALYTPAAASVEEQEAGSVNEIQVDVTVQNVQPAPQQS